MHLGLFKKPGVLDGDRSLTGDRFNQPHRFFGKVVLLCPPEDEESAYDNAFHQHRHKKSRSNRKRAQYRMIKSGVPFSIARIGGCLCTESLFDQLKSFYGDRCPFDPADEVARYMITDKREELSAITV